MSEREKDTQWEEHVIDRVDGSPERGWTIHQDGCALWIPDKEGARPEVGDVARFYGRGFGYPVRGVDLNGVEVYYETEEAQRARFKREQEEANAKKKAEWLAKRDEMDRRLAALPLPFQMRICRFRHNNPDFGWEYEPYEMSACVDGAKIAAALNDASEVETFQKLPWEEQKKVVPDLDTGHSGNTFGMAVRLAYHMLTNPDYVWMDHAAISPLVGCECGCPPVKDVEVERALYEHLAASLSSS